MSHVLQQRQWTVATTPDPMTVVIQALIDLGLVLDGVASDHAATLRGGSNLLARSLGVMLVNPRTLPKQVRVRLDHGDRLTITYESTLRWAILDRYSRKKYLRAFAATGDSVDAALRDAELND